MQLKKTFQHTFTEGGSYSISLSIKDKFGAIEAIDSDEFNLGNIKIKIDHQPIELKKAIIFSSSNTTSVDPIQGYSWELEKQTRTQDGNIDYQQLEIPDKNQTDLTYTFAQGGIYRLHLTITDSKNNITTKTLTIKLSHIEIYNLRPSISESSFSVELLERNSNTSDFVDSVYPIKTKKVEFKKDRQVLASKNCKASDSCELSYRPKAQEFGEYQLFVSITDEKDFVFEKTQKFVYANLHPSIVKPSKISPKSSTTFSIGNLDASLGATANWQLFDDTGAQLKYESGETFTHSFNEGGHYKLQSRISTKYGQSAQTQVEFLVGDIDVKITKPETIELNKNIEFSSKVLSVEAIASKQWSVSKYNPTTQNFEEVPTGTKDQDKFTHKFAEGGNYQVKLSITDTKGNLGTAKTNVKFSFINIEKITNNELDNNRTIKVGDSTGFGISSYSVFNINSYKIELKKDGKLIKTTNSNYLNTTFSEAGTYSLSATLTDEKGTSASKSISFTVSN